MGPATRSWLTRERSGARVGRGLAEVFAQIVRENGVDGVVTIECVSVEDYDENWTNRVWSSRGQYSATFALIGSIGSASEAGTSSFIVSLWDVRGQESDWKQVWAARTDSYTPNSVEDSADSLARFSVAHLDDAVSR